MEIARGKGMRLILSLMLAVALLGMSAVMAGCDADTTDGDTNGDANGETPSVDADPIEIGWVPWDEDIAVTYLWKHILESEGYEVNLTQLDIAPVYAGVAEGDLDLYLDAWLPITHGDYADEYDENWEYLGVWNDNGLLTWAVPDYVDVQSIPDLKGKSDMFNGQIIGIEAGAGLMRLSKDAVIPGYGLEEYTLVEGSTSAMLAELDRAVSNEEPIVVTLWRPHWAYGAYPMRDLEDPEGHLGGAEELHVVAHKGFSEEYPEVAEWLTNFKLSDEEIGSLTNTVIQEYGTGQEAEGVEDWLSDPANQALVDGWLGK
jgi:glycine betaine/proline transport system substrate-binding protein